MNLIYTDSGKTVELGQTIILPITREVLPITQLPEPYGWNTYVRGQRADGSIVDVKMEELGMAWQHPHRTDIPEDGSWHEVEYKGLTFRVKFPHATYSEPPWEMGDGYGIVSGWRDRAKRPGERVLQEADRGTSKRYYDWAGTVARARAEHWDALPYNTGTAGERAVRAAEADFKFLKAWCNDEWRFVDIHVECNDEEAISGPYETWKNCHVDTAWEMIESMAETILEKRGAAQRKQEELQDDAAELWGAISSYAGGTTEPAVARADGLRMFNRILLKAGLQPIALEDDK